MTPEVYPAAEQAIKAIWRYTDERWGEEQADRYVMGLFKALESANQNRMIWRAVTHPGATGVYFIRYESHVLFFRELGEARVGLISVLHQSMDLPRRLQEDMDRGDT